MENKTSIQKIKELFPLTFHVTQELLDKSSVVDPHNCNGANSLREIIKLHNLDKEGFTCSWGAYRGIINSRSIWDIRNEEIHINSNTDMMHIEEPTDVVFNLDR